MGEVKETVGVASKPRKRTTSKAKTTAETKANASIIERLTDVIDDLDHCITVKEGDVITESKAQVAENHFKVAMLRGADSLVRRARAMLEDYGTDLELTLNPAEDAMAADGEDLEEESDIQSFADKLPEDN